MSAPASKFDDEARAQFLSWLEPTTAEDDYEISEIEGEIPRELNGTLFRNGPSQRQLPPEGSGALHLFDGDGLVHQLRFEDGRAHHRSRFVRTESFLAEEAEGRFCMGSGNLKAADPLPDIGRVQPNTNVVHHAGRLFALVENAPPFEIDAKTLEPIGPFDYDGKLLGMSTTAHPKIDGKTGQMIIHGYQPIEPYAQLYTVEADGSTSLAENLEMPWPSMMHDLAISQDHVILPLGPIVFDINVMAEGGSFGQALSWQPERGLKFGIRSREPGSSLRWFDAPTPGYMFHPGNAYEKDGVIYMDACTYLMGDEFIEDLASIRSGVLRGALLAVPFLYEFDLATGECRERQLSDRPAEFPRIDDRLCGHQNRFGYAATSRTNGHSVWDSTFSSLVKYDRTGAASVYHELPEGRWTGEPVFAPASDDAAEDEGFVMALIYDGATDRSCLQIHDARDFGSEPVARLWLQNRVPLQFHGNWAQGVV
jgi:carotenoid cleavage dioxygenase-like enzyme